MDTMEQRLLDNYSLTKSYHIGTCHICHKPDCLDGYLLSKNEPFVYMQSGYSCKECGFTVVKSTSSTYVINEPDPNKIIENLRTFTNKEDFETYLEVLNRYHIIGCSKVIRDYVKGHECSQKMQTP